MQIGRLYLTFNRSILHRLTLPSPWTCMPVAIGQLGHVNQKYGADIQTSSTTAHYLRDFVWELTGPLFLLTSSGSTALRRCAEDRFGPEGIRSNHYRSVRYPSFDCCSYVLVYPIVCVRVYMDVVYIAPIAVASFVRHNSFQAWLRSRPKSATVRRAKTVGNYVCGSCD